MDPFAIPQVNVQEAILGGLKLGAGIDQIQAQRQQQAAAQAQAQAMREDVRSVFANPDAGHREFAGIMMKYPQLAEPASRAFKLLDEGKQRGLMQTASRIYSLSLADPAASAAMMRERAKLAEGEEAQNLEVRAKVMETNPSMGRAMWAADLAGMLGGKEYAGAFATLQGEARSADLHPSAVRTAEAGAVKAGEDAKAAGSDATIKAVQAQHAPQVALLDLQKKGWDIRKIQEDIDIAKQSNRIAAMNAATAREGNTLRKQELELKVQEARTKLEDGIRAKAADIETARGSMDNLLSTADRALKMAWNPEKKMPTLAANRATGPVASKLPTVSSETADFEAIIETLGSQAFMAQVPNMKGLGALSEKEGDKLQASLQNLSLRQSPERLVENIKEAQRLILKARKTLTTRYGVPDTIPDTPQAAAAAGPTEIDAIVNKWLNPPAKK